MSTLLILLVVAVTVYLVADMVSRPRRGRTTDSVAEFHRALDALDPRPRRGRPQRPRRARGSRPPSSRRPAA
jgi:hypothetical protein